ncbi:Sporulation protein YtrH [Paenibacillaceae bacterium GAS479]|nr:Sporulation protein YtrH [Paenibacillaceae bacterium GAS479]
MNLILSKALIDCFIAFGVVVGGALLAGIGSVLALSPPSSMMVDTASRLKIWALVAAVGGTIDPMRVIESNMIEGHLSPVVQQVLFILCAFVGAHAGTELIRMICRGSG